MRGAPARSLTNARTHVSETGLDDVLMKIDVPLIALAVGITAATGAQAQDVSAGETLYQDVCRNCHGPKAQGLASFPKLADKTADYLSMRLEQYRAGERVGANSALMMPHAKDLSDEDIANLAAYITTAFE